MSYSIEVFRGSWDENDFDSLKKKYTNGKNEEIDSLKVLSFVHYIQFCKENNITLILEFAPIYSRYLKMSNTYRTIRCVKKYADQFNIPFLDYSEDSMSDNTRYFYDIYHLNAIGSEVFSQKLANDLKAYIRQ